MQVSVNIGHRAMRYFGSPQGAQPMWNTTRRRVAKAACGKSGAVRVSSCARTKGSFATKPPPQREQKIDMAFPRCGRHGRKDRNPPLDRHARWSLEAPGEVLWHDS